MSPTIATSASVVYENQNLLNIPAEVPEPMRRGRARVGDRDPSMPHLSASKSPVDDRHRLHVRQGSSPMAIPEMIARGLLERGESLGINKTVMNAVSELKVSTFSGIIAIFSLMGYGLVA